MEESEKKVRRSMKKAVAEELGDFLTSDIRHALFSADPRIVRYCEAVIGEPHAHNLFELLGLKRFLSFFGKYEFRPERVKQQIYILEFFKYPGASGIETITLSPIQAYAIAGIFGFWKGGNKRLAENVLLFVPRKFGKTTIISGISASELIFGDANGQIYNCANSNNQAEIGFKILRTVINEIDPKNKRFKVNLDEIVSKVKGRTTFATALANVPERLDGLNVSLYTLDEYSQAKSSAMRDVMNTATGVRLNPLELIITTASDLLESPFVNLLNSYKDIMMGNREDDTVFALILEPDVDDAEDDPATWRKVQPHLGVTIQDDYYEKQWVKAQESAEAMKAFRTKLLNVFVKNEEKAWVTGDEVRDLERPFSWDAYDGTNPPYCMVSFDLSVWDDFSAVTYEIYDAQNGRFHFHTEYYLPEGSLSRHPRRELYMQWAEEGHLKLLPGTAIDYEAVVNDILAKNGKVMIIGIGYDPYKAKTAINMLQSTGAMAVLKPMKQTYGSFTGCVETLEMMVKLKTCSFSKNPITPWCFSNCVIDEDRIGNRKPIKAQHTLKIDGAITCLMCQEQFNTYKR